MQFFAVLQQRRSVSPFGAAKPAASTLGSILDAAFLAPAAGDPRWDAMQSATFRKWLIEKGCRIEARSHARHRRLGAATVIVQREGRRAELPLVGSRKRLDPDVVHAIVDRLVAASFRPRRAASERAGRSGGTMIDWNVVVGVKERGYTMARQILEEYGATEATRYQNLFVMKVESPTELMSKLAERLARNPDLLAYVSRIAPAECTFDFAARQDFEDRARDIALRWLPQLGRKSFYVRMHRRGLKAEMSSQAEERFLDGVLLQALEAAGAPGTIRCADPDAVIDIETVDGRAGMALWTRDDLRRHAFLRVD